MSILPLIARPDCRAAMPLSDLIAAPPVARAASTAATGVSAGKANSPLLGTSSG